MQNFNYHTHTARCGHAVGTDAEYVQAALRCGYTALGFSEHIQFRACNGQHGRIDFETFPQCFQDIRVLGKRYKDQISIFCGIEAEFIIEYAVRTGLFCIVAHPDYFMRTRNTWSVACVEASWQICQAAQKSRPCNRCRSGHRLRGGKGTLLQRLPSVRQLSSYL